jgi:thiol-disulfide isomerase/thioredoxin
MITLQAEIFGMKKTLLFAVVLLMTTLVKAQNVRSYKVDELMQRVSSPDTIYIMNFWATWCGPCLKELPEFDKLKEAYANKPVKIVLVSVDFPNDYPKKVVNLIRKRKLTHEIGWLNETDANYFIPKIDNRWQGSIPATLIINNKNGYKNFFEGMVSAKQLQVLIDKQLALMN